MTQIYLMPYRVYVKDRSRDQFVLLGSLPGGVSLGSVFGDYLEQRRRELLRNIESQKLLSVVHIDQGNDRIAGRIRTGAYGFESELVDADSGEISYHRRVTDAELMHFYFAAALPAHDNSGLLLLERFSIYSAKGVLIDDFQRHFAAAVPRSNSLNLMVEPLISPDTARDWIHRGRVFKVRLIRKSAPSDLADMVARRDLTLPDIGEAELTWKVRRGDSLSGSWKRRFLSILDGETSIPHEFSYPSFEPETVKIELEIEGKTRTIDLADVSKVRAWYDVSSLVEVGPDGHPTFGSIDEAARRILDRLRQD